MPCKLSRTSALVSRIVVGLIPQMPHEWAGKRMLPPRSLPKPSGEPPAAMIAASPPLDPPGERSQIPGVLRAAVQRIVGLVHQQQLRHVGLAQHDRAGAAQPGHERIVDRVNLGGKAVDALGRSSARDVKTFLDRDRHAVQRAERLAALPSPIGFERGGAGLVKQLDHDRVESRIDRLDAANVGFDQFRAGQFAGGDLAGHLAGRERDEIDLAGRRCLGHGRCDFASRTCVRSKGGGRYFSAGSFTNMPLQTTVGSLP